jgi:outer membrane receptor protein involved in Fe transport
MNGTFKSLLLAGCAGSFVIAAPAMAQETPPADTDVGADVLAQPGAGSASQADAGPDQGAAIVVTGSRIQRRDFEANSPIVSVDEALLQQSSTSAIEQNLNKLPQFSAAQRPTLGGDIQPTATNTPGAATLSLRGIGANRNLVLLDGRRATPSNASGVVDVSTIPSAALERVEIISGGASATYGADAVAGVTNFILKKNFQGLELDGQMGISQEGDAFEYQFSGIMGSDFEDGRGNISLAMSVNTREASYRRDRDIFQDLWSDPNAAGNGGFFLRNPGIEFGFGNPISQGAINSIFTQAPVAIPNENVTFFTNPDGTIFTGDAFVSRGGAYRSAQTAAGNEYYKVNSAGDIDPVYADALLILPLTRYNALARGNYEITDNIGVFGQAMFSRVETFTRQEAGPLTGGWATSVPYGTGVYTGGVLNQYSPNISSVLLNGVGGYVDPTPGVLTDNPTNPAFTSAYGNQFACAAGAVGGCTNSQLFASQIPAEMQALLNARANPNAPFTLRGLLPEDRTTDTNVTTYNLLAGFEGTIPGLDWSWEAFVNHGQTDTFANQQGIYSLQRLRTLLTSPGFGQNFRQQGNAASGGFGASTGTCTSGLNPFGNFQNISEDCQEAVAADLKNRSSVRQTIVEANLTGSLFEMWAGDLQFALGASYRELDFEFLNDTLTTQGRSFQDQALGIYPSGNAEGFIETKELYGELLIPLLRDTVVDSFSLELGGRMSDYNTTGTSYTYKILGDLEVTDWLRFRGGYNRAERAPNIGELFLAAQQTFGVNNRGDVCSRQNPNSFSANPNAAGNNAAQAAAIEATCRVLMEQSGNASADEQYYSSPQATGSFGFAFPTLVGNTNLRPETADTWTAGMVLSSPFTGGALSSLRLSVDYFNIAVDDAIAPQTVGSALQQCFDPALNPLVLTNPTAAANSQFCQNVPRNQDQGGLGNVLITYVNNGRFRVSGIDVALDWSHDVGPGTVTLNSVFNYLMDFKSADLPTNPLVEYAGTFGTTENGLTAGAFEYKVFTTLGYRLGGTSLALQWQHLPSVESSDVALIPDSQVYGAPSYNLFNLNGSAQVGDSVTVRFGVDNLFNKRPPLSGQNLANTQPTVTGNVPGGAYRDEFYDILGRRLYVGANIRF